MSASFDMLRGEERVAFALRELYRRYGYVQYKMSKFEEYDLYARNKDFLVSDHIITFTDTNGKLMALKPDVTLSIVRNSRDADKSVTKVHYDENVYRVTKGARAFREIRQVGLECIGTIDDYYISEVLLLAAESLRAIGKTCALHVSHLGVVSAMLDIFDVASPVRGAIVRCIGEKNLHELAAVAKDAGVSETAVQALSTLALVCGTPDAVAAELRALGCPEEPLCQLLTVVQPLIDAGFADMLSIDFSVINDMTYYNGIIFKGFVDGVPTGVLSGGRYDALMEKMGRRAGAVGFAVYLDQLERLEESDEQYDVDVVLLYDEEMSVSAVHEAVRSFTGAGLRVTAQRTLPEKLRYRQLIRLRESGVETNA